MLGLVGTGDGASFNAASAASVAADVRWKKLTGMFGQPLNYLTCSLAAPERQALQDRARPLAFVGSRIACVGGEPSEGWLRGSGFVCLLVSYKGASSRCLEQKEAGTALQHRIALAVVP